MAIRGLMTRIPIWVRVPGIIALVLVGVLISTMLLGGGGDDGGHGSGDETDMRDRNGGQGRGHGSSSETEMRDHNGGQGGDHGSGDESEMRDHDGAQAGPAVGLILASLIAHVSSTAGGVRFRSSKSCRRRG
jgi:hypothetical protein